MYRTKIKGFTGPHNFISSENETVGIQNQRGTKIYSSNCVSPYVNPIVEDEEACQEETTNKGKAEDKEGMEMVTKE